MALRNGVPLHPVYVPEYHRDGTLGGDLHRFSCPACVFSTDRDVRETYTHDREVFDIVSGLEQQTGFTMTPGRSPIQIVSAQKEGNKPAQIGPFDAGCDASPYI